MNAFTPIGPSRWSFLHRALVTVPVILLLGFASGRVVPSGDANGWYRIIDKPGVTPPGIVFPIVWTMLYILLGLSLAMILDARGARGRGRAIGLFVLGFAGSLAWTPLFFGLHRVWAAGWLIVAMVAIGCAAAVAFARIRRAAAWLLVPYLVWISFAGILTFSIARANPDAEHLAPTTPTSQMP